MTPDELSAAILRAAQQCVDAGDFAADLPADVTVERPRNADHGDYATNIAMRLAKGAGQPPRTVAEAIAARLGDTPGVKSVEVAGPGFLNITLDAGTLGALAKDIVEAGAAYGRSSNLAGRRINLEFVSANPTGPVHLGGSRWAAVGDALARLLEADGAEVTREYYFNDHGAQIDRFARSLLAQAHGRPAPEDGYGGAYIGEIADRIVASHPDVLALPDDEAQEVFRREGVELMFAEVKQSLHDFGVDFDVYFHENSLHESGAVERAVAQLKDSGRLYFEDGAWWLRSTEYGDDKDRVVIKSDGQPA
ncbi:arginine--tRNA ligase, partial [Jatrophihabitans endophyticus]|uniref:arginine--tRNA ligase domain-containing protein n=1 Tax=Jatrophihabitans endophyticus TaxID=1206085 RepID=UPI0019E8D2E6